MVLRKIWGSSISSKEWTNKFDFTTMIPQVDLFSFVFWRKSTTPKNHFEINWPLNAEVLLTKSAGILLIFLLAIIWPMNHQRNSEKISILKIWQLVFFWGVKTYFSILPLKWCIFRHWKNLFLQIVPSNSYFSH